MSSHPPSSRIPAVVLAASAALLASYGPLSQALDVGTGVAAEIDASANAIPHLSGGIGEDGRAEMDAASADYGLRVVDAQADGAFVAGVRVQLHDANGKPVFEGQTEGPILLLDPPPGRYTLKSTYAGQTQTREVTVQAQGQQRVDLRWDAPPDQPKTRVQGNMETVIELP